MRWTESDNLRSRDAVVHGGPYDGLRVAVRFQEGTGYRYPAVFDLSGYAFDEETWTFNLAELTEVGRAIG